MAYTLRPARLTDAGALTDCIDTAYAGYIAKGIELPPVSEGIADDIRHNVVIVANEDQNLLGGVILSLSGETALLKNVAVKPDQSGRGIGKALILEAISAAQRAGCTRISLVTHRDMPRNISLYESLGWHVTKECGTKVFMDRAVG